MVSSVDVNTMSTKKKQTPMVKASKTKKRMTIAENLSLNRASQVEFKKSVALTKKKARVKRRSSITAVSDRSDASTVKDESAIADVEFKPAGQTGVVYLGHIPHGFYENEMEAYFTQFGTVLNVKLARSNVTGNSKGYAFIHFESDAVAKIVAETMNNYLMFERILECHVVPPDQVKPSMFEGKFRHVVPKYKRMKALYNKRKSAKEENNWRERLIKKVQKTAKKLARAGIAFNVDLLIPPHLMSIDKTKVKKESAPLKKSDQAEDVKNVSSNENYLEIDTSDDEITFKVPPNTRTVTIKKKKTSPKRRQR